MMKLSVNLNKVALLRNSRPGDEPSVTGAGVAVLEAGAHGLTVHPRPDQRHIRPGDCDALRALIDEWNAEQVEAGGEKVEFNIEGNPLDDSLGDHLMPILRRVKPDQATLVPDLPGQSTSDHGWDVRRSMDDLRRLVDELHEVGCRVSLFMDPDMSQLERVPTTGADRIELYTEGYAKAFALGGDTAERVFQTYKAAATAARELGLEVNAGHDLNLANLPRFATIEGIAEVSIGHALIGDALVMGWEKTVKAYLKACGGE